MGNLQRATVAPQAPVLHCGVVIVGIKVGSGVRLLSGADAKTSPVWGFGTTGMVG